MSQASISISGIQELSRESDGNGIYWTSDRTRELPIIRKLGDDKPVTVCERYISACEKYSNLPAMKTKQGDDKEWTSYTFKQYRELSFSFAKALISLNIQRFEVVTIIGFNSPEWFIGEMGTIIAGCIAAGIYTSSSPDMCLFIAQHCKSRIILVENEEQREKIISVRHALPHLRAIVQWSGNVEGNDVYSWLDFMNIGLDISDEAVMERIRVQKPGNCCLLIYTSGTTGTPKAGMISHDNITWLIKSVVNRLDIFSHNERIVSYLPLSHIAAQLVDIMIQIEKGICVYFARPDALKGSLIQTLTDVRPTAFLGVPRVWEKIEESLREVGMHSSGLVKLLADWAKSIGFEGSMNKIRGEDYPYGWWLSTKLLSKIHERLGLDRAKILISSAAPISRRTLEYFLSLNLPILESYGMSETTGPHSISTAHFGTWYPGWSGITVPGAESRLSGPNNDEIKEGEGELCCRGRHIFMGYMDNPEETKNAIDAKGWLHTGDLANINEQGMIRITGRLKELIKTAGGEYIAHVPIENELKNRIPAISNAMVVGDQKKFASILLTLKVENGSDKLSALGVNYAETVGSNAKTVSQAIQCEVFQHAIQNQIDEVNQTVPHASRVQYFRILDQDFSEEGGEITPTMKIKRKAVLYKYAELIDSIYARPNL